MYERPILNRVGAAEDVILGAIATGDDIDTLWFPGNQEYADDGDDAEGVAQV